MAECRPQDLGEGEDEVPVRDGPDHLLPDEFRPQGGAFGRAGRTEPPLLAGYVSVSLVSIWRDSTSTLSSQVGHLSGLRHELFPMAVIRIWLFDL